MTLIKENVNLSRYTSFKVGGDARYFAEPKNIDELYECLQFAQNNKISYFILGMGSNIIFKDSGVNMLCIRLTKFDFVEINGNKIKACAGASLSKISAVARRNSLTGFEEIGGIPGTLGGGIWMNAGAYGREIKDVLISSTYLGANGEIIKVSNEDHDFEYRYSFYKDNPKFIILEAEISLEAGNEVQILARTHELRNKRVTNQPLEFPSAGSTFKRPKPDIFVGKLLEDLGLKGYSIGGAKISEKHAGFIINYNKATANDILQLIDFASREVFKAYGITLDPEVLIIGD